MDSSSTEDGLKLATAGLSLVGGIVSLIAGIVNLRRFRLEVARAKTDFDKKREIVEESAANKTLPVVLISLIELEEDGDSPTFWSDRKERNGKKIKFHALNPLTVLSKIVLFLLRPAEIPAEAPVPPRAAKRLRTVTGLSALSVLMILWPVARSLVPNQPFWPSAIEWTAYLVGLVVVGVVLRVADK